MWNPGEVIAWRGLFRGLIWHAMPTYVINDTPQEIVLAIVPGAVCKVDKDYGRKSGKRVWDFIETEWKLDDFVWHTNRVLFILEPEKHYSINLFWNHASNEFIGYYVNFQYPYVRNHCGIDAMDLELDIDIEPDLNYRWKDVEDYKKAIECGIVPPDRVQGIEAVKPEILERIEKRQYPFDGSWVNWKPDPDWSPPRLPDGWDKI
jgi:protein associated with RNAse G/E